MHSSPEGLPRARGARSLPLLCPERLSEMSPWQKARSHTALYLESYQAVKPTL